MYRTAGDPFPERVNRLHQTYLLAILCLRFIAGFAFVASLTCDGEGFLRETHSWNTSADQMIGKRRSRPGRRAKRVYLPFAVSISSPSRFYHIRRAMDEAVLGDSFVESLRH